MQSQPYSGNANLGRSIHEDKRMRDITIGGFLLFLSCILLVGCSSLSQRHYEAIQRLESVRPGWKKTKLLRQCGRPTVQSDEQWAYEVHIPDEVETEYDYEVFVFSFLSNVVVSVSTGVR